MIMLNLPFLWKSEFHRPQFRQQLLLTVVVLVMTLAFFSHFLMVVEGRQGVVLDDPVLKLLTPRDLTWLTFGVIYIGIVAALGRLLQDPRRMLLALQCYTVMVWVRIGMMFLVPLDPPPSLIVLQDPLVQLVAGGAPPTRDLFFSGHTSTLFLLALVMDDKKWRRLYYFFTAIVGMAVLWQHVHYAIDVVVAPFIAYTVYRVVKRTAKDW